MDFIDNHGDVLDVVLRASLWTNLYRGRIVGLLWCPCRGWCGWRFNHDGWDKIGMSRYRHVTYSGQHQCRV